MKSLNTLSLVLATASLLGSASLVQAEGLTREQVKAELAEARRNGALIADPDTGATFRDLAPHRYPALPTTTGKSREQVKAELAEAQRNGTLIANVDTGATYRDLAPDRYPAPVPVAGKTREQVRLELAEAIRLGDIPIDDSGRTLAERFPGTYAPVRAEHALALKRQSQHSASNQKEGPVVR
jgi:Domain of unknown function (DUF4148)